MEHWFLLRLYLLRGDIKADCPEVHLLVGVDAGDDEEYARTLLLLDVKIRLFIQS